ncbi:MAG TPA: hypothetical protein VGA40_05570, partial [Candidatus Acidoferrales bacterium]
DPALEDAALVAAALWHLATSGNGAAPVAAATPESKWKHEGRREQVSRNPRETSHGWAEGDL